MHAQVAGLEYLLVAGNQGLADLVHLIKGGLGGQGGQLLGAQQAAVGTVLGEAGAVLLADLTTHTRNTVSVRAATSGLRCGWLGVAGDGWHGVVHLERRAEGNTGGSQGLSGLCGLLGSLLLAQQSTQSLGADHASSDSQGTTSQLGQKTSLLCGLTRSLRCPVSALSQPLAL